MGPCSSKDEMKQHPKIKAYVSEVKLDETGKVQKTQQISDIFACVDLDP
jgi:hypothetical protein